MKFVLNFENSTLINNKINLKVVGTLLLKFTFGIT